MRSFFSVLRVKTNTNTSAGRNKKKSVSLFWGIIFLRRECDTSFLSKLSLPLSKILIKRSALNYLLFTIFKKTNVMI